MEYTSYQKQCQDFNNSQTEIGTPLMTLRSSKIRRSRFGVGKPIGGNIYLYKDYYKDFPSKAQEYYLAHKDQVPFEFNCIRYDMKVQKVVFIECADFNESREPLVGRIFVINDDGTTTLTRSYQQIYHHKWAFVRNDYTGFNVEEAWNWSRKWLNTLTRRADGSSLDNWLKQLNEFGLE